MPIEHAQTLRSFSQTTTPTPSQLLHTMVLQRRITTTGTTATLSRRQSTASFLPALADNDEQQHPSYVYHNLVAGVCSGTATSIVCAPLDLLRTRMQVLGELQQQQSSTRSTTSTPRAVFTLMRHMWQTEGMAGYFRGLHATLWTVPAFWGVYCT